MSPGDLTALVLCGGRGTRAYPQTATVPKPLLEVAGRPILEHVLRIYAAQGVRRFVLAAGFRADLISAFAEQLPGEWSVAVADSGPDTGTGRRIELARDLLGSRFFATYGDGVANIDLAALLDAHLASKAVVTLTSVPLRSQFGTLETDQSGAVVRFQEKPVLEGHWINGGFMVFDEEAFDMWAGEDLEREVLPSLAASGTLYAYRHRGFWRSMDTYKDALELTALATPRPIPWYEGFNALG